uniref:Factor of DNA methylation 1-5/IDN2 domain-containing protein n=1 Tax=Oryza meridionalis TaxID=40149 RepID=A0A0E0D3I1_9ORYZ
MATPVVHPQEEIPIHGGQPGQPHHGDREPGDYEGGRLAAKMGWHEGTVAMFAVGAAHYLEIIKEDDWKLQALRAQYGDEACNVVVKALVEMNEYNPSGRYPVPELWNFKENRRAPMPEAASYLLKQWKTHKKRNT